MGPVVLRCGFCVGWEVERSRKKVMDGGDPGVVFHGRRDWCGMLEAMKSDVKGS